MDSFQCSVCKSYFATEAILRRHRCEVHAASPDSRNQCEVCEQHFGWVLRRHLMRVYGDRTLTHLCEYCGLVFTRKDNLRRHQRSVHGPKSNEGRKRRKSQQEDSLSKTPRHEEIGTSNTVNQLEPISGSAGGSGVSNQVEAFLADNNETFLDDVLHAEEIRAFHEDDENDAVLCELSDEVEGHAGFTEDPVILPSAYQPSDSDMADIYTRHWGSIRRHFRRGNPLLDTYNFRISSLSELEQYARSIFSNQDSSFRINISVGYILRHSTSGELRYFHSSLNNNAVFAHATHVRNEDSLELFLNEIRDLDILEWARQQRPNSKWVVELVTNVTYSVTKVVEVPIGAAQDLPDYIMNNKGLYALIGGSHGYYEDYKCLFRCLAILLNKSDPRNCEKQANTYYEQYLRKMGKESRYFRGVNLDQLSDIERLFKVIVYVYELNRVSSETTHQREIVRLIRRPSSKFNSVMRLNLYDWHFSFIYDMDKYAHCFVCRNCGDSFSRSSSLLRHEKSCDTSKISRGYF